MRHRTLLLGGSIIAAIAIVAILGPSVAPYNPTAFAVRLRLSPPSFLHLFGTDEFGRDVFSRVLAGAHYSFAMGFGAMLVSLIFGVPLGLTAAFHRRTR